jgi:predicted HD phosphohydrolase
LSNLKFRAIAYFISRTADATWDEQKRRPQISSSQPEVAMATPQEKAAGIIQLLTERGEDDYIGEEVSQLAHSLQAAHLAKTSNADDATTVAALLHDIGHFLPSDQVRSIAHEVRHMSSSDDSSDQGVGRIGHERIGEEYLLRIGFPRKVAALVGSHVAAKRYLCATDQGYHSTLSDASKKSLVFQGGPMEGDELARWARNPWCREMCQLRHWDDCAKVVGLEVPPVKAYQEVIERLLS